MITTPSEFKYVWLLWARAFMLPWTLLYVSAPAVIAAVNYRVITASPDTVMDHASRLVGWCRVYEHIAWRHGHLVRLCGTQSARSLIEMHGRQ